MSDSQIDTIADALRETLEAAPLDGGPLSIQRKDLPVIDIGDVKNVVITIVPKAERDERLDRSSFDVEHDVDIAVQKKVKHDSLAETKAVRRLVEQIADLLKAAGQQDGATYIRREANPLWIPEHLQSKHQYTNVTTYTYRKRREHA